jgi:hypothetical protein
MPSPTRLAWAALRSLGRGLVVPLILFEQWGWSPLARALGRLTRWQPVARLEERIARLAPRQALALLCVPALLLLPVKIGALWLLALGRVAAGLLMLVAGKLLGTAVVARLFLLTHPQLMRMRWFERGYRRWVGWQERIVAGVRSSLLWTTARALAARVRAFGRGA